MRKGEELEGDGAFELRIFGLIDDTHPTFPELLENLVMGYGLADHGLPFAGATMTRCWNGLDAGVLDGKRFDSICQSVAQAEFSSGHRVVRFEVDKPAFHPAIVGCAGRGRVQWCCNPRQAGLKAGWRKNKSRPTFS